LKSKRWIFRSGRSRHYYVPAVTPL
jgi:hypothetical protein